MGSNGIASFWRLILTIINTRHTITLSSSCLYNFRTTWSWMFQFKPYFDHLCTKYNRPLRWKQATTLAKTKSPRCANSMPPVPLNAGHILVAINSSSTSLNPMKSPDLVQSEFKAARHPRSSGDRGWSAPLTVSNLAFSKSHRKFFASVSKWLSQTNVECYFEKTLRNFNKQW